MHTQKSEDVKIVMITGTQTMMPAGLELGTTDRTIYAPSQPRIFGLGSDNKIYEWNIKIGIWEHHTQ